MNNSEWIIRTQSGLVECTRADCKWRCGCVRQKDSRSVASQKRRKKLIISWSQVHIMNFRSPGTFGPRLQTFRTWEQWSQVTAFSFFSNLGLFGPRWPHTTPFWPDLAGPIWKHDWPKNFIKTFCLTTSAYLQAFSSIFLCSIDE